MFYVTITDYFIKTVTFTKELAKACEVFWLISLIFRYFFP